jgi:hypothetical protein
MIFYSASGACLPCCEYILTHIGRKQKVRIVPPRKALIPGRLRGIGILFSISKALKIGVLYTRGGTIRTPFLKIIFVNIL